MNGVAGEDRNSAKNILLYQLGKAEKDLEKMQALKRRKVRKG